MKNILMILVTVALVALPATAQTFGNQEQPQTQFQSTSTMQASGSSLVSQPMLNEDGTAYNPSAAAAPAKSPSGPRRVDAIGDPTGNKQPIGDAVLPLMLMALAFGGVIYLRRRKARA